MITPDQITVRGVELESLNEGAVFVYEDGYCMLTDEQETDDDDGQELLLVVTLDDGMILRLEPKTLVRPMPNARLAVPA